jgi:hypothetical protein
MPKRYSIVGTQFTGVPENFMAARQPGEPVVLIREPDNQYDTRAVAVWIDGIRVGYIPKNQNAEIAAKIDRQTNQMALDQAPDFVALSCAPITRQFPAKFVRSPNSGFPQVEVSDD